MTEKTTREKMMRTDEYENYNGNVGRRNNRTVPDVRYGGTTGKRCRDIYMITTKSQRLDGYAQATPKASDIYG
jgi:hypothetical protein